MKALQVVVGLLVLNLACQTKSRQGTEAGAVALPTDSTAMLTNRPGLDAPRSAADRLVRALYFEHSKVDNPFREKKDRRLIDQFFVKSTADLIWNDARSTTERLKWAVNNPLFNAPDKAIHKMWVEPAAIVGSRAVVYVTFLNNGKPQEIRIEMQQLAGRWRIVEMHYPGERRLTQLLRA